MRSENGSGSLPAQGGQRRRAASCSTSFAHLGARPSICYDSVRLSRGRCGGGQQPPCSSGVRGRPESGLVPLRGRPGAQAETFVFVYIGASVFLQTAAWGKGLTWSFLVRPDAPLLPLRPCNLMLAYITCIQPTLYSLSVAHIGYRSAEKDLKQAVPLAFHHRMQS